MPSLGEYLDAQLPPQPMPSCASPSIRPRSSREESLLTGRVQTLHYGNKSHRIAPPENDTQYDLFLTRPFESTRVAARLPTTTSLFTKPPQPKTKQKTSISSKGSGSGLDSDIEALQNGLAAHQAGKERFVDAHAPASMVPAIMLTMF